MASTLTRLGLFCARRPRRVLAAWFAALVLVSAASAVGAGGFSNEVRLPGTSSARAGALLERAFPTAAHARATVLVHRPAGLTTAGPADLPDPDPPDDDWPASLERARDAIAAVPHVAAVADPVLGPDRRTALLAVTYDQSLAQLSPGEATDALRAATAGLRGGGTTVAFGGQVPEAVQGPSGRAEAAGSVAALLILVLAFGSVLAAGLPLAVALLGVGITTGALGLLTRLVPFDATSPTLASMIGLGVGIDYALLVTSRHREYLAAGDDPVTAAGRATGTAGRAVLAAGATVLAGLCGLAVCGVPAFALLGAAAALVVAVTVLATLTAVPALLALLGPRLQPGRPRRFPRAHRGGARVVRPPLTARFAAQVGRHPVLGVVAALAVLLALAAPALGLRLGQSDPGSESPSRTTRQAYDLTAGAFGPGANGPLIVAVDLTRVSADRLAILQGELAARPDVAQVEAPRMSPDGTAGVLTVLPRTAPADPATARLVADLHVQLPAGAELTGPTAVAADMTVVLAGRLPLVVGVVVGLGFLILVLTFRAVVVPLKAALMNLLSIGAAFGVLRLAFQTDTGAHLLGLPGPVPIVAWAPVIIFAVVYGLSMDYEVFLLSRIREDFLLTADPKGSVVRGLSATARLITSAAAVMVVVFVGFALDPSVLIKIIGVGMATAVLVDATVIRLVLVPATMTLLGRWNWWCPAWLERVLPSQESLPAPAQVLLPELDDGGAPLPVTAGRRTPANR